MVRWTKLCLKRLEQAVGDYIDDEGGKKVSKKLSATVYNMSGTLDRALRLLIQHEENGEEIACLNARIIGLEGLIREMAKRNSRSSSEVLDG
jgi:hypothetical protein